MSRNSDFSPSFGPGDETPRQRALREASAKAAAKKRAKVDRHNAEALSVVGRREDGTIACPNCGSTSFKERRTRMGRLAVVAALPAAAVVKKKVRCTICGTFYEQKVRRV